jgi:hypothetical protein
MILATEMTKHFEHLAKFVNVFSIKKEDDSPDVRIHYCHFEVSRNHFSKESVTVDLFSCVAYFHIIS